MGTDGIERGERQAHRSRRKRKQDVPQAQHSEPDRCRNWRSALRMNRGGFSPPFETGFHLKAWTGYKTILLPQFLSTDIMDVSHHSRPQVRTVYHSGQSSGMTDPNRSINPQKTKSWSH